MNDYSLVNIDGKLQLRSNINEKLKPLCIDFTKGKSQHRRLFPGKELIAKAAGIKKNIKPIVIDATAGLGRDAFVLASLGCEVHLIERSPLLYQLLEDALQRTIDDKDLVKILARMHLHAGDAKDCLQQFNADVIYCDPMYPERKKSALVKKEMRILREVNGDDVDADELFLAALEAKVKRVVVKRPMYAENSAEHTPDFSYNGKHTRFDVYLR